MPEISKISSPVRLSDWAVSPAQELQRQNAHAHQVRAVDAFVAFRDHGAHSQQARAFGRPVAGGAGAVFFSCEDHQRHSFGDIFFGGVEDRHFRAVGQMAGEAAFEVGRPFLLRRRTLAKVPRTMTS